MGTHFLWNPINDNIVKEFDDAGNTIADYTTEPTLHGDVISQHRDGESSFYHSDGQGNVTSLTDKNGDVTDTCAYSAFGDVTQRTGRTVNPFQFVGRHGYYTDDTTGTLMVRQNTLVTDTGRWLSPDAAIFGAIYAYVHNNPCLFIDPSGLLGQKVPPENELSDEIRGWINLLNPFNGPCASYGLVTSWLPDPTTEKEGFIIQRVQVKFGEVSNRCERADDLTASLCAMPQFSLPREAPRRVCNDYIEIWRVHNGKVYSNNVFGPPTRVDIGIGFVNGAPMPFPQIQPQWGVEDPIDIFADFGYKIATKGHMDKEGDAIFVSLDSLKSTRDDRYFNGDLENELVSHLWHGGVRSAGGLFSGCTDEALWRDLLRVASGPPINKKVTKTWNCCPGQVRLSKLTITVGGISLTRDGQVPQVDGYPGDDSPAYGLWCRKTDC